MEEDIGPEKNLELRRDVTVWGSFMWGFADVGANTFVAMGLVIAASQGAAPLTFALAGVLYILIGLAFTELASAYPVAGGGPYFTLRGLGDFWGFVAGCGLILAYTIDIALFATACAGYINFFLPWLVGINADHFLTDLGPFHNVNPFWCFETLAIIGLLIWLNVRGVRESSILNEIIGAIVIVAMSSLIVLGFVLAWKPDMVSLQWKSEFPSLNGFMYGSSLAIISFVGLESISQAAQETRRPATVIPRTSIVLIFSVFIFAVSLSTLGLGILPWQVFAEHQGDPIAALAKNIPYVGVVAGPFVALLGALVLFISSNTGVMGSSRLAYSMSQFQIIGQWFSAVHPRYRTPAKAILAFSLIAIIQTILAFLTPSAMNALGDMYAFGATLEYGMVFIALLKLRISDPYTPRPYKMPWNIKWDKKEKGGKPIEVPVLGLLGLLGIGIVFVEVILTHEIGRVAGPAWVAFCFLYYAWYRRSQGLPIFHSVKRNWESDQIDILESAEEYELLEEYKLALAGKGKEE